MAANEESSSSWLDKPLFTKFTVNWEIIIFSVIILLAITTRFYDLGTRVMSHDENNHIYFAWLFSEGQDYVHDPVTHGPFQFHLLSLSYFMFGASDFSSRIPAALFSIATVAFLWFYRRYLGRAGALVGAAMFLISPYLLYYGRYTRNEAFVALFGLISIWALLRYIETGENRYLYYQTVITVLHLATKETAFIYIAQALIFVGFLFLYRISKRTWKHPRFRNIFLFFITAAIVFVIIAGGVGIIGSLMQTEEAAGITDVVPAETPPEMEESGRTAADLVTLALIVAAVVCVVLALVYLIRGFGWRRLAEERAFSFMLLLFTLILPHLAPFPIKILGWDPLNYRETENLIRIGLVIGGLFAISAAIGFLWNWRVWFANLGIFYAIFTVLFTSVFTNGYGFFSGLVGSLGYWLSQQAVERGSQPWYYYSAIQIPIYEFLPAIGCLLAVGLAIAAWWRRVQTQRQEAKLAADVALGELTSEELSSISHIDIVSSSDASQDTIPQGDPPLEVEEPIFQEDQPETYVPTLLLLVFWILTSSVAYAIAGEKMPWLTVHIAWPMILFAAWGIGRVIDGVNWRVFKEKRGPLTIGVFAILVTSFFSTLGILLSAKLPFQGQDIEALGITSQFIFSFGTALISGYAFTRLIMDWEGSQVIRVIALSFFALLSVITTRSAFTAAYINHDYPTEFLVYAHSGPGVKDILNQVEEISKRTTGGLGIVVGFDDESSYPFWWYLRDYDNKIGFGSQPSVNLREAPVILAGAKNYGKLEHLVADNYYQFDYIRIWWPNQDYFNLTPERILNAIRDPNMRAALWDIWFKRDFTRYGLVTGNDYSLENWSPSGLMRMYIRKDVAASIWDFGVGPTELAEIPDYMNLIPINPTNFLSGYGIEAGLVNNPRGLAVAADGSVYIADMDNHRIQHLAPDGSVLHVWGSYGQNTNAQPAPNGSFNQPGDVAIGPDGFVYITDTWNHRIQKFTPDGQFVLTWGGEGFNTNEPYGFYGPRGLAVSPEGYVLVTDTGNHRVLVFDSEGQYLSEFGGAGFGRGQFYEPVGIAVGLEGQVYVVDTWNQRVQVFTPAVGGQYFYSSEWEVYGWYGQSLENKPHIAVDSQGHVFITDPERYRVVEFTSTGEYVRHWEVGNIEAGVGLPIGISVGADGTVWISDGVKQMLISYLPPVLTSTND